VIRLIFIPTRKIEVGVWWNRSAGAPDVQLVFGMYGQFVELGSLKGNGFDAPRFHRMGFGTLMVNIAVQALQSACDPAIHVQGMLSNTAESVLPQTKRARLEENRRQFWRRFGLEVVTLGEPPSDFLRGRVGELCVVPGGTVGGQFSRLVALNSFQFEAPPPF